MITLGILRTDYMLDSITDQFKQVEINTIASSFSGVGTRKTKQLYDNILKKLPLKSLAEKIPSNKALENIGFFDNLLKKNFYIIKLTTLQSN